jgi:hypothetical protein
MIGEIAQLLDNLALIVGAFLDDLSGLFGARGLVFRFVVGGAAFPWRASYCGGRSSLESQRSASSDFRGSGRSQSRHWNVRRPLPPGGSARIKNAPQPGQVGRLAWPMGYF